MSLSVSFGKGHLDCFMNSSTPASSVPTFQYSQTPQSPLALLSMGIGSFAEAYFEALKNGSTSSFPLRIWLFDIMSHSISSAICASAVVQSSLNAAQKNVEKGVAVDPCSKSAYLISAICCSQPLCM